MSLRPNPVLVVALAAASFIATNPAVAQQSIAMRLRPRPTNAVRNKVAPAGASAARVNANGDHLLSDDSSIVIAQVSRTATNEHGAAEAERVVVRGEEIDPEDYPALPDVQGTRINSGKKTSAVKPNEEFPTVANNNYREALSTQPGLIVSEEPNSPIVNIGYRGLDSQRAENTQILKDGISVKNEQFGFPESHYTPILDSVERIEFVRAGAALQFGPQPGGAINFVTKMPTRDAAFHFMTKNAWGTDEFYQNFTSIDGTYGALGYYAFFDHREREGFRPNHDYWVNNGSAKFVIDLPGDSRIILTLDAYVEEHGEPGGLRRREAVNPAGSRFIEDDRNVSTRLFDRFRLERFYGTAEYEKTFSEGTELSIKAFGGYLLRYSKRQRGGGFGTVPTGAAANSNSLQWREVWNEGAELRLRHDYALAGDTSTFGGGLYFYHALQDRRDERGATADANFGALRNLNTGETWDGSIFAENRFKFGRLSITPGMRLEFLQQSLNEELNVSRDYLLTQDDFSFVPLFGLGASYVILDGTQTSANASAPAAKQTDGKESKNVAEAITTPGPPRLELYGTVSQAYRPRTYGDLVPTSATGVVNGDLEEGHSLQFEIGLRGKPLPFVSFDVGGFFFTFDDQIAEVTLPGGFVSTQNVGDARFAGFEAAVELDVLALANRGAESPVGKLNLYGNITLLDAEFTSGPFDGRAPTYAPDHQFKTGVIYRWKDAVKVGFIGTIVDTHYADANNSYQREIPAYNVWDLTAEVNFRGGRYGVFGGVNNVFDKDFWAESRDEGILPAYRRNYYVGVKLRF
jgi:Fe(3+) dicitrate transport protein